MSWSIDGAYARCDALAIDGVAHGFGSRSANRPSGPAAKLKQVHGNVVVRVSDVDSDEVEADGVWERLDRLDGRCLAVRTADCVPILLAARDGGAIAAVHAGWRGTALRIAARAVALLGRPGDLVAALGPAIGPCCYPVSAEVATELTLASGIGVDPSRADLRAANRSQLLAAGIPAESIHLAPWCTSCESGLFHSHRRDGAAAGRQWSLIGAAPGRP